MSFESLFLKIRPIELAAMLKYLAGISYREQPIGKRTFWLDPASDFGNRLIREGGYETLTGECIVGLLEPGGVFVDVGANEGYFSVLASEKVGASGRVYAIEPQARLWSVVLRNFLLNGCFNYQLMPYAAGDKDEVIEMILYPSINSAASTAIPSNRRRLMRRQKAWVKRLDHVFESSGITRVDVMKIDVEGFELNVLSGLGSRLGDGSIRNFLIEYHPLQLSQLGQSVEAVESALRSAGYDLKGPVGGVHHWARR